MISIHSDFDGGNIDVLSTEDARDIRLAIRKDNQSDFYQWFYYRLSGAANLPCRMVLTNAGGSAYTPGWTDYAVCVSYDRESWFRVPTTYEDGDLIVEHTPAFNSVYYAYFAPYSMERHADLIHTAQQNEGVALSVIGTTLDGQTMDLLTIGSPAPQKRQIWVTARQHPGETMAEWWCEGFLDRLLDMDDPVARVMLDRAVFYVVPNMNPDGSRRGHLRTNAVGVNLNREWDKATPEQSPEVHCVLAKMRETGCDLALDVHGDENLPYNFIAGGEGAPGFTDRQQMLLDQYKEAMVRVSPDFQTEHGYPVDPPGGANMGICTNFLTAEFDCLAMTLEMPFKDNANLPDPQVGWSPERCRKLGAASLDAMCAVVGDLR